MRFLTLASHAKPTADTCQSHRHRGSRQRWAHWGRSHPAAFSLTGPDLQAPKCKRWSRTASQLHSHPTQPGHNVGSERWAMGRRGGQKQAPIFPAHSPICAHHITTTCMYPGGAIIRIPVPVNYCLANYLCFYVGTASFGSREGGVRGAHTAIPAEPTHPHALLTCTEGRALLQRQRVMGQPSPAGTCHPQCPIGQSPAQPHMAQNVPHS